MKTIDVKHIAKLAFLPIPERREAELAKELEETIKHVNRLQAIDTSTVAGTNEVTHLENIWRKDEVKPSLSQEDALKNAKRTYNGFFVVPAIFGE